MRRRLLIGFVSQFALASFLYSQVVGGSISGTVRDQAGSALPGAKVTIINNETGGERTIETDSAGRYAVPSIAIGSYNVAASKTGFQSQIKTGVNLVVGQAAQVDLVLPVGELHEV